MIASTLFIRVVPQDRDRGFMMLIGYDPKIIQRTATQYITMNAISRESFNETLELVKKNYRASEIKDVTASGILKQLRKLFGEPEPEKLPKVS